MAISRILSDGVANTAISRVDGDLTLVGATGNLLWDKSEDDLIFPDNAKAIFGAGSDLQIYHDGTNSVISAEGDDSLYIQADNIYLRASIPGAENGIVITGDGAVDLYHDNVKQLSTRADGIDITHTNAYIKFTSGADSFIGSGAALINSGNDDDLIARVDTGDSFIVSVGASDTLADFSSANINFTKNVGIGTTSPDGPLHVHTATAGSVTAASSTDDLIVENSAHAGISVLSPDASYGSLAFGSPSDNHGFLVDWYHAGNTARVHTSKVGASLELKADNSVANLTLSGASGSEIATFTGSVSGDTFAAKTNPGIGTDQMYMGFSAPNGLLYSKNSSGAPASNLYLGTTDGSGNTNNVLSLHYDGKVGIGVTAPQGQAHIHLGASSGDVLRLSTTTSGSGTNDGVKFHMQSDHGIAYMNMEEGHHAWYSHNGSSVGERMKLSKHGSLAINTTLPTIAGETGTLVIGDSGAIVTFDGETNFSQNVYYNSGWKYRTTDIASILQMGNGDIPFRFSYAASGSADAATSFTEAMQIDGNGHVGIGIAADSTFALKLQNPGGHTYHQMYGPTGYVAETQWYSQNASGSLIARMDNAGTGIFGTNVNTPLLFYTNNAEEMRITNAGLVGIGTTAPDGLLHVHTGSAGTWTAPANFNDVVIESNTNAGLVVAVPDADEGLIGISSPSHNGAIGYGMLYDYDVGIGRLFTSKVGAKTRIEADNQVTQVTFDGAAGSQFAEFANDIGLKSDSSKIYFGADNDVTLTHVADTGLLLNSTRELQFRDSALKIYSSADGQLDLAADTEIELTSTTVAVEGVFNVSSTSWLYNDVYHPHDGVVIHYGADHEVTLTHVHNTGLTLNKNLTVTGNYIKVGDGNAGGGDYDSVLWMLGDSSSGFKIGVNAANSLLRIDREYNGWQNNQLVMARSTGNVGIGTTSPGEKLQVDGAVDADNYKINGAQGSDGQVLTSTGSGVAWEAAGGGAWVRIGSFSADDDATLDVTGFDVSTYDVHAITWTDVRPMTDDEQLYLRFGDSGGFDSGASDYDYVGYFMRERDSSPQVSKDANEPNIKLSGEGHGYQAGEGFAATMFFYTGANMYPTVGFTYSHAAHASRELTLGQFIGQRNATITLTKVQIYVDSGNVRTGNAVLYGLVKS